MNDLKAVLKSWWFFVVCGIVNLLIAAFGYSGEYQPSAAKYMHLTAGLLFLALVGAAYLGRRYFKKKTSKKPKDSLFSDEWYQ